MNLHVFLLLIVTLCLPVRSAFAQLIQVQLNLDQPQIINETTLIINGKTNLPPGTEVTIQADPTARPDLMPSIKGGRYLQRLGGITADWVPAGKATVTPQNTFAVTLKDPHKFKTGKYQVAAQVWVCSFSLFGKATPQSKAFYEIAGPAGENLQGPLVHRQLELLTGQVAVTTSREFEFRPGEADQAASKEKKKLQRYAKAIDDAYKLHLQLLQQGVYAQWTNKNNLQANRLVVNYGLRLKNTHKSIRPIETQEAFFLFSETVKALEQVHYWSLYVLNPEPEKYTQAETEYIRAKARLDDYIAGIK